ncbi:hypothetical protein UlMin_036824 [Ulmus minor]
MPTNATGTVAVKRIPSFNKVDQLKLGSSSHTLTVKVVSSKIVKQHSWRPSQPTRIAECLVGDETGGILFTNISLIIYNI